MFPVDLEKYPLTEMDLVRVRDLMRILPKGGRSALDVGALWGYFSEFLSSHYGHVTALDLEKPQWELPRVTPVAGDITRLQFPDNTFDLVFCAEVLEHIPQLTQATSELARVTRKHLVIGVPFEQDLRLGRPDLHPLWPRQSWVGARQFLYGVEVEVAVSRIEGRGHKFCLSTQSSLAPILCPDGCSIWPVTLTATMNSWRDACTAIARWIRPARRLFFGRGCCFDRAAAQPRAGLIRADEGWMDSRGVSKGWTRQLNECYVSIFSTQDEPGGSIHRGPF